MTNPIIDIAPQWLISLADFIQMIGFGKGGRRWYAVVILLIAYWIWNIFQKRQNIRSDNWFIGSVLIGVFLLKSPDLLLLSIDSDEGEWISGAATLVHDYRFWYAVDGTTSGPLTIVPLALIHYVGASINYATVRLFGLLIYVLPSLYFVFRATKTLINNDLAKFVTIPIALAWILVTTPIYNSEYPILLLLSLLVYCYAKYSNIPRLRWLLIGGIVAGLMPFAKPQVGPLGIIWGGIFLWVVNRPKISIKSSLWLCLAGILPTLFIAFYLTITGIWDDFLTSYIYKNLKFGTDKQFTFIDLTTSVFEYFRLVPENRYWLNLTQLFVLVFIVLKLVQFKSKHLFGVSQKHTWVAFIGLLAAVFCVIKPFTFSYHYQTILYVPTAFFSACFLFEWRKTFFEDTDSFEKTIKISLLSYLITMPLLFTAQALSGISGLPKIEGSKRPAKSELGKVVSNYTQPNEQMASWGICTGLYVETGLLRGTRDGHTAWQMSPGPFQNYLIQRFVTDMKRNKPKVFVETFTGLAFWGYSEGRPKYGIEQYPALYNHIKAHYQLVADLDEGKSRVYIFKK